MLNKYKANRSGIDLHTLCFYSSYDLLEHLDAGYIFDLFLLDILMPGLNGIELAKKLRVKHEEVPLIFLTSSVDYAFDAFRVSAAQYILKPITEHELFPVLDKLMLSQKPETDKFFMLSTSESIIRIPFNSIVCIELYGRVMRTYLENGRILHSKSIRTKFSEAVHPLLQDSRFLCAHKSYVLNMMYVEELTVNSFRLKNNIEVPVPRYVYAKAKSKYFAYLSER